MEQTAKGLPLLAEIGAGLRWLEELVTIASGPLLTAGLAIALIDLLTDGRLLASQPTLLYAWAISQAVGVDGQLIGAAVKAGRAMRAGQPWRLAGYSILILALGYVAYLASNVFATQQALGISTQEALARLGMDATSWIVGRSLLAVLLVVLSGMLRYDRPQVAAETAEARAERRKRELEDARHKAELTAMKAAGFRGAIAAGLGNVNPLESSDESAGSATLTSPDEGGEKPGDDSTPRQRKGGGVHALRSMPTGHWTRADLQRYAQARYDVIVEDEAATRAMAILSNGTKNGRSYVAHKATVKAWVDRTYGARQAEGMSGTQAGTASA
jgi:hypothetical protein